MLYILSGPDDFSLAGALAEIKREIGDQALLEASTTTLDGQQVTLDQLRTVCETVPFLSGKRLVIIDGLLERFQPRGRPRRQRKSTRTGQRDEHKAFAACIVEMPDSTVLVLRETRVTGSNPLFGELAGKAVVKAFPLLRDARLRQWVQRRVAEEGGSLSSRALEVLTSLVGSNLWVMANEVSKLVLFTSGRRIEEADVTAVVSHAQQASVFAMVDAIVEFKIELAEQSLQELLRRGVAPAYLLFMLARQMQMIVRARELTRQRKPRAEIQGKLGLTSEFALRKTLEQASRYSVSRLKEVYRRLLDADLSIKTSKYPPELTLNILVAELCRRRQVSVARPGMG